MREREVELVDAAQEAFLAEGVDVEGMARTVRADHRLRREIDLHARAQLRFEGAAQRRRRLDRKGDRQEAVLEAVLVEDVAEARRDDGAETVIPERIDRMLARGAAAEILIVPQDARVTISQPVQHEVGLLAPAILKAEIVEEILAVAVLA